MAGCSIRALWILNSVDDVSFSKRFPVVEKRWKKSMRSYQSSGEENGDIKVLPYLPTDTEIAVSFSQRKKREGSLGKYGIRTVHSSMGSDSWVDDPIVRHIISLSLGNEEHGESCILWPVVFHTRTRYRVLILPLVEPKHVRKYTSMCGRADCGSVIGSDESLSSLIFGLPCLTGALTAAHAIGDVIAGDPAEPDIAVGSSQSVGGLLDSLGGSIGIRAKPVSSSAISSALNTDSAGNTVADSLRTTAKPLDRDLLRSFITSSMPFGTPLDLNYSTFSAMKAAGFGSADGPISGLKQPAWKPYLYKGKQKIVFIISETVSAAIYDRDDTPDFLTVSGKISCRVELEGIPDICLPLTGMKEHDLSTSSFHPCVQSPHEAIEKRAVTFSPPLGGFVLMNYQASCGSGPPVRGFYQLSMLSENEGAFLFRLELVEGYKGNFSFDFCTAVMTFPRRRVVGFEGIPSVGTITGGEHVMEWRVAHGGRGSAGKSVEASFSGTVKFSEWRTEGGPSLPNPISGRASDEEEGETMSENVSGSVDVGEFLMEKMNRTLPSVDLEEPFSWQAYSYARVHFRITGISLSGIFIDTKSVRVYPVVKAPVEVSYQVVPGDYILWNTLGRCPSAVAA